MFRNQAAPKIALFFLLLFSSCRRAIPEEATWSGTVDLAEGSLHLPFRMVLDLRSTKPSGYFLIGDQKAPIPEITRQGDSLAFEFSEYGAEMRGTWDGNRLDGIYVRRRADRVTSLKFSASPERSSAGDRKIQSGSASAAGKYHVYFDGENRAESVTVATLSVKGDSAYGTFIAPDGDYGLLTGTASGGKVQLNRFTGWQAIAITLEQNGQGWLGKIYAQGGKPRVFTLEPAANLDVVRPARMQTAMKNPETSFRFEGVSASGETLHSSDDRFRGRPLIVDIMGTWCHNCIDESPLLQELQTKYGKDGLQVVGISFEITDDLELAKRNLKLYQDRLGLTYTMLFCGSLDDENVKNRLRSQLDNFFAYPTTLFIGRDGKVQTIHSGFRGPGTGEEFQVQVQEFHELAEKLVK